MASYHLSVKPVSRASGRSAVGSAAYRAGVRLTNERDGVVHDFTHRRDVEHAEIVLPEGVHGGQLEGLYRGILWNVAEAAEKRCDARPAREVEIALPAELSAEARRALAVGFGRELAQRYGVAVDVSIHAPHAWGDQRNHHAHLLMTTRRVEGMEEGGGVRLGEKSDLELSDTKRKARGLGRAAEEIESIRGLWAGRQNQALEQAREAARVDHRSFERQGLAGRPTQHLGPGAAAQERRGVETERGDRNRAVLAERQARQDLVLARADLQSERLAQRERRARLAVNPEDEGLARQVEQDRRERLDHAVALAERRSERRQEAVRRHEIKPYLIEQARRARAWLQEQAGRVREWLLERIDEWRQRRAAQELRHERERSPGDRRVAAADRAGTDAADRSADRPLEAERGSAHERGAGHAAERRAAEPTDRSADADSRQSDPRGAHSAQQERVAGPRVRGGTRGGDRRRGAVVEHEPRAAAAHYGAASGDDRGVHGGGGVSRSAAGRAGEARRVDERGSQQTPAASASALMSVLRRAAEQRERERVAQERSEQERRETERLAKHILSAAKRHGADGFGLAVRQDGQLEVEYTRGGEALAREAQSVPSAIEPGEPLERFIHRVCDRTTELHRERTRDRGLSL